MTLRNAAVAAACFVALTLGGCLSSADEPFPLNGGDEIGAPPGDYACRSVDARGAASNEAARLVRLRRDRLTQYALVTSDNSTAEPTTLHRVKDRVYVAAVAHEEAPGEDLYLVEVDAGGAAFRLYQPAPAALDQAPGLATQNGATIAHSQFSDDLGGPPAAQRAFVLTFAADLKNWRQTTECKAKKR